MYESNRSSLTDSSADIPASSDYANIPQLDAREANWYDTGVEPEAPLDDTYANVPKFAPGASEHAVSSDAAMNRAMNVRGRADVQPDLAVRAPGYLPDVNPRNLRSAIPPRVEATNAQSNAANGTLPEFDPNNRPSVASPFAKIPDFNANVSNANAAPSPRQQPRREPKKDEFGIEKPSLQNPSGDNDHAVSKLPERAIFKGQIVAKKANGGLILKSTPSNDGGAELIHLPPSATRQLEKNSRSRESIQQSMQNGRDGAPVEISHFKGKWSANDTSQNALRAKRS